jgi:hypothetical protein
MYLQGPYEEKKLLCRILVLILYFPCWYDAEAAGDVYLHGLYRKGESELYSRNEKTDALFLTLKLKPVFCSLKSQGSNFERDSIMP